MKNLILILTLLTYNISWGQGDTLFFDDEIEMTDKIFELLDSNIYGKSLLNRAVNGGAIIEEQINENYNQIFGINEWVEIFNAVSLSYKDHSDVPSIVDFGTDVYKYFGDLDYKYDKLVEPFCLILNTSSFIDSSKMKLENFEMQDDSIKPIVDENTLYKSVFLKTATLLEFYPDNGYLTGHLIYNPDYIITSEDITVESIEINVGDGKGFQLFNEDNPLITYSRNIDSTVAQVKVIYTKNGELHTDRINFYLTTNSNLVEIKAQNPAPWDTLFKFNSISGDGVKFKVGVKFGCGNNGKFRRPIIIAPPYRPTIQPASMEHYWNQFNIAGLLESYVGLGYDVIWVKEKPGNKSLQKCGNEFANLIKYINLLKKLNYPYEDWESIVMGYSKGGQDARYALKKLEKEHMEGNGPHPHTKLYLTFDSPHHGVNIPLYAQSVYREFFTTNLIATTAFLSLIDGASSDMGMATITASSPPVFIANHLGGLAMTPHPHQHAVDYQNEINNDFNHIYTNANDTRRSFPAFTRNVAVSTGSYKDNYSQYFDFNFLPGELIFKQHAPTYNLLLGSWGMANRKVWASKYNTSQAEKVFRRLDAYVLFIPFPAPYAIFKTYKFKNAYEWDMAQGGYKDNFLDKIGGPIPILRSSTYGIGTQYYDKSVMFLPLVSALGINPSVWQNNNLYYNLQDQHMFYSGYSNGQLVQTDIYGYPHLGHPTNHFNITPFEAVYADKFAWDHIVFGNTLADYNSYGLGQYDLGRYRDFLNDEVEPWNGWLQNKVIGQNHKIDPNYEYKAWYKCRGVFSIGHHVTPKTDPGDYIIQSTGNITVYANEQVHITTGFHAQAGSKFHAYIYNDGCAYGPFLNAPNNNNNNNNQTNAKSVNQSYAIDKFDTLQNRSSIEKPTDYIELYPNPNTGQFMFVVKESTNIYGQIYVYSSTGQQVYSQQIKARKTPLKLNLENGVYIVVYKTETLTKTIKLIVQ